MFFFVCIAIGVGAIVALRSVIQSVRGVLTSEARTLIAADILLSTDRPWQQGTPERIATRVATMPVLPSRIDSIEMADHGAAGGRERRHHEGRRAARRAAGISVLRPAHARGRAAVCACAARRTTARSSGPELLTQLGIGVGDEIVDRPRALHDSRRHRARARAIAERRSASGRAC